ncbi:MAG: sulfatase-like hydrolase/transferase [Solirubrobacterales bacterium]
MAPVLVGVALSAAPGFAQAARPNFVIIQTDDQNARTAKATLRKYLGGRALVMPNTVREIFRGGTEFSDYYVTTPTCAPSRASLLTGQYPQNSGLTENFGSGGGWSGWRNLPANQSNLPVALQEAGYRTSHFGKFINGYWQVDENRVETTVPPGWDNWFTTSYVSQALHYGYQVNDNGVARGGYGNPMYNANLGTDPERCSVETLLRQGNANGCRYQADVITRAAVREIRRNSGESLYLQIDYEGPHGDGRPPVGPQPATRHVGSTAWTPVARPPNFNESDMSDKSSVIQNSAPERMGFIRFQWLKYYYLRYLASLRAIDDGVGAIIETLRQTGKLENTYIFFLSDNGVFLGEHRFDHGKFLPYDGASQVAMAVRGPGVPGGGRSGELVANIDIAPTLLQLAGTSADWPVDGRTLIPFWRDPSRETRRPVGSTFARLQAELEPDEASLSAASPVLDYRGFRVGPYKYFRFNESGEEELYDMSRDPWELRNRINSPAYIQVKQYMRTHLPVVDGCVGAGCQAPLPQWPSP